MSKEKTVKKEEKKAPTKTLKEKRGRRKKQRKLPEAEKKGTEQVPFFVAGCSDLYKME